MIRYRLRCAENHAFDGWFRSSEDCDAQLERGLVTCAQCGSCEVAKALMAPSLRTTPEAVPVAAEPDPRQRAMLAALKKLRDEVVAKSEYVGPRFAEEARRIHYEESDKRGIYGEATPVELRDLHEEGIDVHALPVLPEDRN